MIFIERGRLAQTRVVANVLSQTCAGVCCVTEKNLVSDWSRVVGISFVIDSFIRSDLSDDGGILCRIIVYVIYDNRIWISS